MPSPLDMLLDAVKGSVGAHADQQKHTGFDPSGLIDQISNLFGQHQAQHNSAGSPLPASRDPYGDPADQSTHGNVKPASADPYGDPGVSAVDRSKAHVKPASEDPYGDPADEGTRRS